MLVGIMLLLFSSIFFTAKPAHQLIARLPLPSPEGFSAGGAPLPPSPYVVTRPPVPLALDTSTFPDQLTAVSALVVDDKTNTVLFKKNPYAVRSLASISKLMSALVMLDLPMHWSSTTVVEANDIHEDHQISVGQKYTLDQLWHIALVGSSNSAIMVLVRNSGISESDFVERMNAKAKALGLMTLRFVEPTGLDDRDMGTAMDIVRLLKAALAKEKIASTLQTPSYDAVPIGGKKHIVWSTDWLLTQWIPNSFDKGQVVGKTGYIDESGYNFTVRISDTDGHVIRLAVLGAASDAERFSEARDLALWAFNHFRWPGDPNYKKLAAAE